MATRNRKDIFGIVSRGTGDTEKSHWQRIGTAFENRDGSWQLLFDYIPLDPKTGIQMRDPKPKEDRS